jgi:hypothetical protein
MSAITKSIVAAFLSGAGSSLTGYMMSDHGDSDVVMLLAVACAGGLMGAGSYLKGLYEKPPNGRPNGQG